MRNNRVIWVIGGIVGLMIAGGLALIVWLRPPDFLEPRPTPPPPAEAQDDGIFYESSFEADAGEWETFDDGFIVAEFNGGQLIVRVSDAVDIGGWSGLQQTFDDFLLETEATLLEGRPDDSSILIVFRLRDTENYNRFEVTFGGLYELIQVRDGVAETVSAAHASDAIHTDGTPNTVRIQAVDNTFTFSVNDSGPLPLCVNDDPSVSPLWEAPREPGSACLGGELVTAWQNDDLPSGSIGLGAAALVGFDEDFNPLPAEAVVAYDSISVRVPE